MVGSNTHDVNYMFRKYTLLQTAHGFSLWMSDVSHMVLW
jgi:hypothetical protein